MTVPSQLTLVSRLDAPDTSDLPPPPPWALAWAACVQAGFDAVRHQHALAVRSRWLPASKLASGRLERRLAAAEGLALGRMARRT